MSLDSEGTTSAARRATGGAAATRCAQQGAGATSSPGKRHRTTQRLAPRPAPPFRRPRPGRIPNQECWGPSSAPRRVLVTFFLLALVILGPALPQATQAADPSRYVTVPASPDGIGKSYMGREIAQVMGAGGAPWLERPERAQEERPDLVLAALDIKPGMVIADIGAGTGYYARRLGRRTGSRGLVHAIEVQPEMLRALEKELARHHATSVKAMLGTKTDPRLLPVTVDLAIMVDVYHELEFPYEMLTAIVRGLKHGGQIVFVEYRANDPQVPIKPLHTMTEEQVRKEAAVHPLEWVKTERLPWQNVIVFRKK